MTNLITRYQMGTRRIRNSDRKLDLLHSDTSFLSLLGTLDAIQRLDATRRTCE
jgi:hypothetical protein